MTSDERLQRIAVLRRELDILLDEQMYYEREKIPEQIEEYKQLIRNNKINAAVNLYRSRMGTDLRTAYHFIQKLRGTP